jgi:hypothetical protein
MTTLSSPQALLPPTQSSPPRERHISTYGDLVIALVILMIGVFYAATIREGNFWPDDYALYVHHAENIAEGRPYGETGYIYNPAVADYSPRAYPPVFPLLLAPVCRAYGLNLRAMKLEIVGFFILTLMVLAAYWRHDLRWTSLLALLTILGLSPIFWGFKDSVVADIPFLLFFYSTALVARDAPRGGGYWWKWAIATGLLLYLCLGTRTVGLSLVAGLVIYEVAKYKKLTRSVLLALFVCGMFVLVQRQVLGTGEQSYADQLRPTLATVISNVKDYSEDFAVLWTRSLGRSFSLVLFGMTTALAWVGIRRHFRAGLTVLEALLFPYLLIVIIWPSPQGLRFLFPLIPFYIYLMLLGLEDLSRFIASSWSRAALVSVVALILLSYSFAFEQATYRVIRQTDGNPAFNDLCGFIRNNTNREDVFVFRRSRALSLFTSRPAAIYDFQHADRLEADFATIHANYIVTSPLFEEDRQVLIPFIRTHPASFREVYENADFEMYRVLLPSAQAKISADPVTVNEGK